MFSNLFKKVTNYFNPHYDFQMSTSLSKFKEYLNSAENTTIRMWVDSTKGYGHQSSSVAILRQLIASDDMDGFNYSNLIECYFDDKETREKLLLLLPELKGSDKGKINNATLELKFIGGDESPLSQVNLGFSGGLDGENNFAKKVNVKYFLKLQPYRWAQGKNELQINNGHSSIVLTKEPVLGYEAFNQRVYYFKTPIAIPNWELYQKGSYSNLAQVIKYVNDEKINFIPTYVIDLWWDRPIEERYFEIMVSMLAYMDAKPKSPIIILACGKVSIKISKIEKLMKGGECWEETLERNNIKGSEKMSESEKELIKKRITNSLKNRNKYLKKINAGTKTKYLSENLSLESFKKKTNNLKPGEVLLVNIGSIPSPLFGYLLQTTNFPPIFEGQGTANTIINIGKYYLNVAVRPEIPIQYPTTIIGHLDNDEDADLGFITLFDYYPSIPKKLQIIANQVNRSIFPWSSKPSENPTEIVGNFIKQYKDQDSIEGAEYREYFSNVAIFYQDPKNDKLRLGLSFLNYIIQKYSSKSFDQIASKDAIADTSTVLQQFLVRLQNNQNAEKVLNFIPGVVSSGSIFDFYKGLLDASGGFQIQNSIIVPKYDSMNLLVCISVSGSTNALGQTLLLDALYTAPQDAIIANIKFSYKEVWAPAELPWIQFSNPFIEFYTIDANVISAGSIGGTIDSAGIELAIQLPIKNGKWQLLGNFKKPYPSINKFYQLAGGVDLTQFLPAPFSAFAGFGVKNTQLVYDSITKHIEYIGFVFSTEKTYSLLDKLTLENISAQVTIQNPGSVANRSIDWSLSGIFKIGSGDDAGVVVLGVMEPYLIFNGELHSGIIKPSDLFSIFLPGVEFNPPSEPTITEFQVSFHFQQKKKYSVSCKLNIDWSIDIGGVNIFTINDLSVIAMSQSDVLLGGLSGSLTILPKDPTYNISLLLAANYTNNSGWIFSGQQTSGVVSIGDLLKEYLGWDTGQTLGIDGLGITIETKTNSYEFTAKTAEPWKIPFPVEELSIFGKVKIGYKNGTSSIGPGVRCSKAEMPVLILDESEGNLKTLPLSETTSASYGEISAEIIWNNIDLLLTYEFNSDENKNTYKITWGNITGDYDSTTKIARLKFTNSTTLGSMIEIMVSWATGSKFSLSSPWNLLDKILLSNFELVYNFSDETVALNLKIGPIDLGFATIKTIGLSYDKDPKDAKRKRVMVNLDADFVFGGKIPAWDVTKPETTPAPEGSGNKYLDLRLLAMGQHVTFTGFNDAQTVQKAIELMSLMPEPKADTIPSVTFAPDSSWLFAADFGVLRIDDKNSESVPLALKLNEETKAQYVLTLQAIFNDPNLYALRVALEGNAAKLFKGLDFQIMYRKLSDDLGVYKTEITLPDLMRHMTIGAYSITLPVFGIEVYTNGDFTVDIGFPWNENFDRSFTIEAIVPPGIPLLGAGGIYFGKIPQVQAVANVPAATNGLFNPILVMGFGARLGLGKSIEYGILKAGFSLTVFGILEGLLAKWNPYNATSTGGGGALDIQGEYFFRIKGTFGLIGNIYGSVDFIVIKADVNITVKVYAQITFASYEPIPITVLATVDATASITVDLWLFSFTISFSFSIGIKETFVIGSLQDPSQAPWKVGAQSSFGRLSSPLSTRLRDHGLALNGGTLQTVIPNWSRLSKPASVAKLEGFLAYALTVAGDEAFANDNTPDKSKQLPCYVTSLYIKSIPPASEHDYSSALKAAGEAEDSSFETLAKMVTRWAIASIQPADVTPEQVDGLVISTEEIDGLLNYLKGTKEMPMPIPSESIDSFLTDQIQFNVSMPNKNSSEKINAAFFPMALPLSFERPAYGDSPALNYTFEDYNELAPDFISWLRDYFNQLAVQVQQEIGEHDSFSQTLLEEKTSVAEFVFSDYFLLIMRQMLQALGDGLRTFKYKIDSSMKTDDMVAWVNQKGHDFTPAFELNDLFEGNADHPLNAKVLTLPGVTYSVVSGDSFTSIAANAKFESSFDAKALANLNTEKVGILTTGQKITYPGKPDYIIEGSMTLKAIADIKFDIPWEDFLDHSNILTGENLLVSFATIALPPFRYQIHEGDTLNSIASAHHININTLGIPENGDLFDLFSTSAPYLNLVHLPQFEVGELIKEAQRVKALEQLSGMVSRYYLHGLRLPTEKISPVKEGMWVTKNPGGKLVLPEFAGLFALSGQQFGIPELNIDPLTITLSRPDSLTWLTFTGDVKSFSYTINSGDENEKRIQALRKYATQNALDTSLLSIGSQGMVESDLSMYPLSSSIPCQTTASIDYPIGGKLGSDSSPRLWYLPGAMLTLPPLDETGNESCPAFNLQLHRYNEATGATDDSEILHYGWATAVEFTIKKLPKEEGDTAYNTTYEIMGASGKAAVLLERLVQTKLDESCSLMTLAYAVNQSGSDSALRIAVGSAITMGLSQANLSTTTRPPTMASTELIGDETEKINLLNTNLEFVRLLWEASITRAGGFYLYFNEKNVGGLPDVIFNDKGEANVTLLVMYNDSIKTLRSYTNAALIGDPISSSSGAVVAQTVSKQVNHLVKVDESAASIIAQYYSTILSLVQNNPTLEFSANAVYTLVNASYLVAVGGSNPGGDLAAIAAYFDMNPSDIKIANPRITEQMWSSALPINTAIRLPEVIRTVGVSPGGTTLQEIGTFYNTNAAAILGENRGTPELIKAGQVLSVSTGPYSLSGGRTPGVQAIGATRLSLPSMPPIIDPDYAKDYLLYLFTMLGYRVMDNQDFIASNVGLPLGPKGKPGSESWDKIRFVKPMSETETMEYSKGLPYLNLISDGNGVPEPITNPFQSIGRLLQIDYSWNDIYGNRLVTQLDEGTPIGGKNPKMPILTGYTDALLGLSQWPGIASYWTVAKVEDTQRFLLQTTMSFDPSPYNKPTSTDSDAWISRAKSAQVTYEKMLEQLTDPNGISMQFKTSLLMEPVAILIADVSALIGWLMEIKRFISDRAEGNSTAPEPSEKTFTLSGTSSKKDLNSAQIFALDFELIINRLGIAQDDFAALPGIRQIATPITPKTILVDINDKENIPGLDQFAKDIEETLSETGKFILTIGTGENRLKTDTGGTNASVWGLRLGETTENPISFSITQAPQIFAPRPVSNKLESKSNITIFDYSKIEDFNPVTNKLIGIKKTLTFSDIDLDLWVSQLFTSVDNLLSPEYLSSILVIDNTSGTHPVGITSFVESFTAQKKALANVAKKLISPVYKVQDTSLIDSAQEALYQQLLNNLSSLYSTKAAVSFSSKVNADESLVSPRLFGNIVFNQQKEINSKVVLTASKLDLKSGEQALTFLVEAPALLKSDNSGVLASLSLDISFNGTSFEHQIADVPNIADYKASTWLSIVRPETAGKLNANLGKFEIPMFIRTFPTTPRMDNQSGLAFAKIPHSLNDLISWNYSFTYSQDYHYAQDRVYGEIEYNLKSSYNEENSILVDAFTQLAQFITAKSNLEKLLKETVPGISAKTDDPEKIKNGGKVLGAYLKMLTDITNASKKGSFFNNQSLLALSGDKNLKYAFHIEEGEYDVKDGEKLEKAWVVKIVSTNGVPPSGLLKRPYMDIPNKDSQEQIFKRNEIPDNDPIVGTNWSKGIYAYWYASDDNKPINGDVSQAIGDRTLYMPGMNILERQDAKSMIYLKRNEELVKDKPSADDFIYRTPSVSFTNPLLPTIDQVGAYNIFQGGAAKSLAETLSLFFTELFENCIGETQTIQLECQYAYSLVAELDSIHLPVMMIPPKSVNPRTDFIVPAGGCPVVDGSFVCNLSRSILNWLSENEPSKSKGELHFDLTIMSDQTEQLMPLIRLRNLFLEMKDLSDS